MNNLQAAFQGKKALIALITCGDPDLETTAELIHAAVQNGADLIELGIPFSDPTAENPVVQTSNIRALAGGAKTDQILDFLKNLQNDRTVPMILTTYANVVFSYGAERFFSDCAAAGISGLILPDLPFEEKEEFLEVSRKHGISLISQIAPTSAKRASMIAKEAEGFLYFVTGPAEEEKRDESGGFSNVLALAREQPPLPCAVELAGATSEDAVREIKGFDGLIVGPTIIRLIEQEQKKAPNAVGSYLKNMREALDLAYPN